MLQAFSHKHMPRRSRGAEAQSPQQMLGLGAKADASMRRLHADLPEMARMKLSSRELVLSKGKLSYSMQVFCDE